MTASAEGPGAGLGLAAALPFAGFLVSIAFLPLLAPSFWQRHYGKVAALFGVPTALGFLLASGGEAPFWRGAYLHTFKEYATFLLLLCALYVTTGGIFLRGNFPGTPGSNAAILAAGAGLASLLGTTGAAMLLIRPLLRANQWRERRSHVVLFFIFSVCNTGGCLTPLGDPPLFLGFIKGVPFGWTLSLWKEWLFVNVFLLAAFHAWDRRRFAEEAAAGRHPPHPITAERLGIAGGLNAALALGVLGAVILQGAFRLPGGRPLPWGVQEGIFLMLIRASLLFTDAEVRRANHFTWHPMQEVAILFAAIFATMVPALELLDANARSFGLDHPWQFFWATGFLSGVLDNAPTYLTFLTVAQGATGSETVSLFAARHGDLLAAVSCGAVFMGALTYIGNAPNFMVKAVAESSGVRMPSFLGYAACAAALLLPLFALVTFIFFA